MAQQETGGLAGWWKRLRNQATGAVADQQEAFVRGKVAGVSVIDTDGNTLVEAGQRIDEQVLARARQAGKIAALSASVLKGQAQDARETAQAHYGRTESAKEARLLESVEEYQEAMRYRGRIMTMDVTDIRGSVIVSSGKTIDRDDVDRAREAGLLSAFLVSAEQSLPAPSPSDAAPPYSPAAAPDPAPRLLNLPEDEETSA